MVVRKQLGQILVDSEIISPDILKQALAVQKNTGEQLGRILIKEGYCNEEAILEAMELQLGLSRVKLTENIIDPEAARLISRKVAQKYRLFP